MRLLPNWSLACTVITEVPVSVLTVVGSAVMVVCVPDAAPAVKTTVASAPRIGEPLIVPLIVSLRVTVSVSVAV